MNYTAKRFSCWYAYACYGNKFSFGALWTDRLSEGIRDILLYYLPQNNASYFADREIVKPFNNTVVSKVHTFYFSISHIGLWAVLTKQIIRCKACFFWCTEKAQRSLFQVLVGDHTPFPINQSSTSGKGATPFICPKWHIVFPTSSQHENKGGIS
jgi:hypothetical protein